MLQEGAGVHHQVGEVGVGVQHQMGEEGVVVRHQVGEVGAEVQHQVGEEEEVVVVDLLRQQGEVEQAEARHYNLLVEVEVEGAEAGRHFLQDHQEVEGEVVVGQKQERWRSWAGRPVLEPGRTPPP